MSASKLWVYTCGSKHQQREDQVNDSQPTELQEECLEYQRNVCTPLCPKNKVHHQILITHTLLTFRTYALDTCHTSSGETRSLVKYGERQDRTLLTVRSKGQSGTGLAILLENLQPEQSNTHFDGIHKWSVGVEDAIYMRQSTEAKGQQMGSTWGQL